ncbi:AAA family ATPase [Treponema sp.]|uniref:AAA family ATPase n=1 Tax=Treponema sp. TaxID=166 RepID=UPI003FD6D2A1
MSVDNNIHNVSVALGIENGKIIEEETSKKETEKNNNYSGSPNQIIYYGVPGCGKSHNVDKKIKAVYPDKESYDSHVIRVVFHPDYTNSDFVGQVMPYVEDGVDYRFKAGPFSRILKHAYQNHGETYYLVIEEINRGNAAAIFGELFQLLDRAKDGFSKYEINNIDITSFIMSQNDYYNDKTVPDSVIVGGDKWILDSPIRLPPNLSILATMNTSDQNVFTLDNAFQRRWKMEYIPNKIDTTNKTVFKDAVKNQYESQIEGTEVQWGVFRQVVNEVIADPENSFSNAEDKQFGLFFIQPEGDIENQPGTIKADEFSNKVLKYLWTDIFKRDKSPLFKEEIKTFGDLLTAFNGDKAFDNCFKDEIVSKFKTE